MISMKLQLKPMLVVAILLMLSTLAGCKKKGDEVSIEEANLRRLIAKPWTVVSVKVDGVDKTDQFEGLTITFTRTGYNTVNGNIVWPALGTWSFTNDQASAFIREDDTTVAIKKLTDTELEVEFEWASTIFGPGRGSAIAGTHVFVFSNL
jgi:hypothetical protein